MVEKGITAAQVRDLVLAGLRLPSKNHQNLRVLDYARLAEVLAAVNQQGYGYVRVEHVQPNATIDDPVHIHGIAMVSLDPSGNYVFNTSSGIYFPMGIPRRPPYYDAFGSFTGIVTKGYEERHIDHNNVYLSRGDNWTCAVAERNQRYSPHELSEFFKAQRNEVRGDTYAVTMKGNFEPDYRSMGEADSHINSRGHQATIKQCAPSMMRGHIILAQGADPAQRLDYYRSEGLQTLLLNGRIKIVNHQYGAVPLEIGGTH